MGRKAIARNAKQGLIDAGRRLDEFYDVKTVSMEVKKSIAVDDEDDKKGEAKSRKKKSDDAVEEKNGRGKSRKAYKRQRNKKGKTAKKETVMVEKDIVFPRDTSALIQHGIKQRGLDPANTEVLIGLDYGQDYLKCVATVFDRDEGLPDLVDSDEEEDDDDDAPPDLVESFKDDVDDDDDDDDDDEDDDDIIDENNLLLSLIQGEDNNGVDDGDVETEDERDDDVNDVDDEDDGDVETEDERDDDVNDVDDEDDSDDESAGDKEAVRDEHDNLVCDGVAPEGNLVDARSIDDKSDASEDDDADGFQEKVSHKRQTKKKKKKLDTG